MNANDLIQYTLVGLCILGAIVWIAIKLFRRGKQGGGGCCGCSLADSCASAGNNVKKVNKQTPGSGTQPDCCCKKEEVENKTESK